MTITILAIETSCDETSAAVIQNGYVLSNIITTQPIHAQYGGVVPELASRAHILHIAPVVHQALTQANVTLAHIDAFAYTYAPGLLGALLVGSTYAKSLALACNKPTIAVHHMQAHVLANCIPRAGYTVPPFPLLCLTVSGGHTQLVLCHTPNHMHIIGTTLDDAAGEAFDKTAKILGLPYPGGPLIDVYAQQGIEKKYSFPEPKIAGYNYSFSGLKTSILYFIQNGLKENPNFITENLADICASVQYRIVTILLNKYKQAIKQYGIRHICIGGGVSANSGLRKAFTTMGKQLQCTTYIPPMEYCTDNAGMIAMAAHYKYIAGDFAAMDAVPTARATF